MPDDNREHPGDTQQELRDRSGNRDAPPHGRDQRRQPTNGEDRGNEQERQPPRRWPWFLGGMVVLVFVAVVLWIIFVPDPDVWTDDAYITVHYATIAPRISGQVAKVEVDDNQVVKAGQVLATLDPRDFEISVQMAEAAVSRDRAQV